MIAGDRSPELRVPASKTRAIGGLFASNTGLGECGACCSVRRGRIWPHGARSFLHLVHIHSGTGVRDAHWLDRGVAPRE